MCPVDKTRNESKNTPEQPAAPTLVVMARLAFIWSGKQTSGSWTNTQLPHLSPELSSRVCGSSKTQQWAGIRTLQTALHCNSLFEIAAQNKEAKSLVDMSCLKLHKKSIWLILNCALGIISNYLLALKMCLKIYLKGCHFKIVVEKSTVFKL